jgi:uncharacterized membrane protein
MRAKQQYHYICDLGAKYKVGNRSPASLDRLISCQWTLWPPTVYGHTRLTGTTASIIILINFLKTKICRQCCHLDTIVTAVIIILIKFWKRKYVVIVVILTLQIGHYHYNYFYQFFNNQNLSSVFSWHYSLATIIIIIFINFFNNKNLSSVLSSWHYRVTTIIIIFINFLTTKICRQCCHLDWHYTVTTVIIILNKF